MKTLLAAVLLAFTGWLVVGCGNPAVENKAKVEAQWKAEVHALIAGDKAAFENLLCFGSKSQATKVDMTLRVASGLAKAFNVQEADLRADSIAFNQEYTQATVKVMLRDAKAPGGWKPFSDPELWVRENGRWLRQL